MTNNFSPHFLITLLSFYLLTLTIPWQFDQKRIEQERRINALENSHLKITVKESAYKYPDGLDEILDQMEDVQKNYSSLYSTTKEVVLCTNPLTASGSTGNYRIKGGVYSGHADSDSRVIYINVKSHSDTTVKHELFHEFDTYFDKNNRLSESDEFLEIGNEVYSRMMRIFGYDTIQGQGNAREFFVDVCIDYTEKKDSKILKEQFPEVYEYLDRYMTELEWGVCQEGD